MNPSEDMGKYLIINLQKMLTRCDESPVEFINSNEAFWSSFCYPKDKITWNYTYKHCPWGWVSGNITREIIELEKKRDLTINKK